MLQKTYISMPFKHYEHNIILILLIYYACMLPRAFVFSLYNPICMQGSPVTSQRNDIRSSLPQVLIVFHNLLMCRSVYALWLLMMLKKFQQLPRSSLNIHSHRSAKSNRRRMLQRFLVGLCFIDRNMLDLIGWRDYPL